MKFFLASMVITKWFTPQFIRNFVSFILYFFYEFVPDNFFATFEIKPESFNIVGVFPFNNDFFCLRKKMVGFRAINRMIQSNQRAAEFRG